MSPRWVPDLGGPIPRVFMFFCGSIPPRAALALKGSFARGCNVAPLTGLFRDFDFGCGLWDCVGQSGYDVLPGCLSPGPDRGQTLQPRVSEAP